MAMQTSRVSRITIRISKGLLGLRRDLVALARVIQTVASEDRGMAGNGARRPDGRTIRRRRRLTPADRARLRIQGEYLGLVRHLSMRDRTRVKALRSRKGYGPAIKMARRLVNG